MEFLEKTINNLISNNFTDEEAANLRDDLAFEPLDTSFLPEREVILLDQREKGRTLEQVAKDFGVTRERIRQLELRAQRKLIIALKKRLVKINIDILVDLEDEKRLPGLEKNLIVQLRTKIPVLKRLITYIESLEQLIPEAVTSESLLDQRIEVLDLSTRSYNALRRAGVDTLRDLSQRSVRELEKVRSLGHKSLMEIVHKAENLGLTIHGADYQK
jgi:DNA-binding CsgD family transcriptional regulator